MMSAASRAEFINSAASGKMIPCLNCNTQNEPEALFCCVCGTKLVRKNSSEEAFQKVSSDSAKKKSSSVSIAKSDSPAFAPAVKSTLKEDEEPTSVFADGLPEWSIEPPQVVVRRKKRV